MSLDITMSSTISTSIINNDDNNKDDNKNVWESVLYDHHIPNDVVIKEMQ
jgi:hypothetical protein